jgi:SAM-dependent methyltransferase
MISKFDRLAPDYSQHDYADPARYFARRAQIATALGPPLPPGATILDLACADANMAEPLLALGYRYRGVDGSAEMIAAARERLGDSVPLEVSLIDDYEPPEPVDMTICLRAYYYAADRGAFFRRVAAFTRTKFVFDIEPRAYDVEEVLSGLRASGFGEVALRPFFLPQRMRVLAPARAALTALERTGPVARAALHVRGIMFVAAVPERR